MESWRWGIQGSKKSTEPFQVRNNGGLNKGGNNGGTKG